jgi:hypothetical protein
MLQVFGFDRVGVVIGDLYFIDPKPRPGQEGAERGVRLEVRMLRPGELVGSIYSARPITIDEPVWRADLLESVGSPPGSLDRAHHHPAMSNWEPHRRVFDERLSRDPVGWIGAQLADLETLLANAGVELDDELVADAEQLRGSAAEIQRAVSSMLDKVKSGELAGAPADDGRTSVRVSWL